MKLMKILFNNSKVISDKLIKTQYGHLYKKLMTSRDHHVHKLDSSFNRYGAERLVQDPKLAISYCSQSLTTKTCTDLRMFTLQPPKEIVEVT